MENTATVKCTIEHHAMLFAFLARQAIRRCGDKGKDAILLGMTIYGNERGARMAANALANGDQLNVLTSQAYGEWKPDFEGQMEFGIKAAMPTFQTYISKCAWCDSWEKHDILEYGKLYCVNIDNAVFQGFRSDYQCIPITENMSFGGERCEFDWGDGLIDAKVEELTKKKKELGTSCMKDFNFHTAHLLKTVGGTLEKELGHEGECILRDAKEEYVTTFGAEYLEVLL